MQKTLKNYITMVQIIKCEFGGGCEWKSPESDQADVNTLYEMHLNVKHATSRKASRLEALLKKLHDGDFPYNVSMLETRLSKMEDRLNKLRNGDPFYNIFMMETLLSKLEALPTIAMVDEELSDVAAVQIQRPCSGKSNPSGQEVEQKSTSGQQKCTSKQQESTPSQQKSMASQQKSTLKQQKSTPRSQKTKLFLQGFNFTSSPVEIQRACSGPEIKKKSTSSPMKIQRACPDKNSPVSQKKEHPKWQKMAENFRQKKEHIKSEVRELDSSPEPTNKKVGLPKSRPSYPAQGAGEATKMNKDESTKMNKDEHFYSDSFNSRKPAEKKLNRYPEDQDHFNLKKEQPNFQPAENDMGHLNLARSRDTSKNRELNDKKIAGSPARGIKTAEKMGFKNIIKIAGYPPRGIKKWAIKDKKAGSASRSKFKAALAALSIIMTGLAILLIAVKENVSVMQSVVTTQAGSIARLDENLFMKNLTLRVLIPNYTPQVSNTTQMVNINNTMINTNAETADGQHQRRDAETAQVSKTETVSSNKTEFGQCQPYKFEPFLSDKWKCGTMQPIQFVKDAICDNRQIDSSRREHSTRGQGKSNLAAQHGSQGGGQVRCDWPALNPFSGDLPRRPQVGQGGSARRHRSPGRIRRHLEDDSSYPQEGEEDSDEPQEGGDETSEPQEGGDEFSEPQEGGDDYFSDSHEGGDKSSEPQEGGDDYFSDSHERGEDESSSSHEGVHNEE